MNPFCRCVSPRRPALARLVTDPPRLHPPGRAVHSASALDQSRASTARSTYPLRRAHKTRATEHIPHINSLQQSNPHSGIGRHSSPLVPAPSSWSDQEIPGPAPDRPQVDPEAAPVQRIRSEDGEARATLGARSGTHRLRGQGRRSGARRRAPARRGACKTQRAAGSQDGWRISDGPSTPRRGPRACPFLRGGASSETHGPPAAGCATSATEARQLPIRRGVRHEPGQQRGPAGRPCSVRPQPSARVARPGGAQTSPAGQAARPRAVTRRSVWFARPWCRRQQEEGDALDTLEQAPRRGGFQGDQMREHDKVAGPGGRIGQVGNIGQRARTPRPIRRTATSAAPCAPSFASRPGTAALGRASTHSSAWRRIDPDPGRGAAGCNGPTRACAAARPSCR